MSFVSNEVNKNKIYKLLYESSADAIMVLEPPDWRFTAGNPAAIKMFGTKNEQEFISLGPWDLSPKMQPNGRKSNREAKKNIEKALKDGSNFFEWTHKKYQGPEFSTTVLLTKITIDGQNILQATVRDITREKKSLKDLEEKNAEAKNLNQLMIGRELKMVELKKEIANLRNRRSDLSLIDKNLDLGPKLQEGVDLEETVIGKLESYFYKHVDDSSLSPENKEKIHSLLSVMIKESKQHKILIMELQNEFRR